MRLPTCILCYTRVWFDALWWYGARVVCNLHRGFIFGGFNSIHIETSMCGRKAHPSVLIKTCALYDLHNYANAIVSGACVRVCVYFRSGNRRFAVAPIADHKCLYLKRWCPIMRYTNTWAVMQFKHARAPKRRECVFRSAEHSLNCRVWHFSKHVQTCYLRRRLANSANMRARNWSDGLWIIQLIGPGSSELRVASAHFRFYAGRIDESSRAESWCECALVNRTACIYCVLFCLLDNIDYGYGLAHLCWALCPVERVPPTTCSSRGDDMPSSLWRLQHCHHMDRLYYAKNARKYM